MQRLALAMGLGAMIACGAASEGPATPRPIETVDAGTREPLLGLNDVSVLEPLPSSPAQTGWLGPESAGARGELLPQAVYDQIPTFPVTTANELAFARMRVVALRIDGCHASPDGCKAQIRVVMQPITDSGKARDSALHLFYTLDEATLALVVGRLRELRALAPEQAIAAPLSISPAMLAQGMDGEYATALHELVLEHCGEENLTRVTFFLRAPPTLETWFFGGFERDGDTMTAMDIVGIGKSNQRVINLDPAAGYGFDIAPAPTKPENGVALVSDTAATKATEEARSNAFASYIRLENPAIYSPDDLPCAGCHLSAFVVGEAQRRFGLDPRAVGDHFASSLLEGDRGLRQAESGGEASSLRAFGYFDETPMISPRVVNETAAVLADLETRVP